MITSAIATPPAGLRPFRFGVGPAGLTGRAPYDTRQGWSAFCTRIEDLGYDALNLGDHFDDRLGPVAALMAAGCATRSLRLGTAMFCNDYRHPAVLAKELATVDALSEGRLEIGLGAGWLASDYDSAGIPFDVPAVRIDRLREAVHVIRTLLSSDRCSFQGSHYRIAGLAGTPRPVQRPHPPFLLGGGGRRMLTLAGQQADIVALNVQLSARTTADAFNTTASAAATDRKVRWVRDAAGPRFNELEIQTFVHFVEVTPDRSATAERLGGRLGIAVDNLLGSPHVLIGDVPEIVEQLEQHRERFGISYVSVGAGAVDDLAPVVAKLAGR